MQRSAGLPRVSFPHGEPTMLRRTPLSRCARTPGRPFTGPSAGGSLLRRLAAALAAIALAAGAAPALANDLSDFPCTAGDVEIVGNGVVVTEPCVIPAGGLLNATVQ